METSRDLTPGMVLAGRYEVLQKLGSGSFSSVYRVRDRVLAADCALKLLQGWEQAGRDLLGRLERELLLGRQIEDPGCCRLFDFAESEGLAFLTMELIAGWRLDALLERCQPLPLPVGLSLAAQAASAAAALHRLGIVHRDLKAQNLMIDRNGCLKLMDLGFSWSAEAASLTASGAILGTPTHMAPEYLLDGQFSVRTDVYALGVLSYQLLTGQLPLEAPNLRALVAMVLESEPVPPRSLRPELAPPVEALVLSCLSKDPQGRPADAGALKARWSEVLGAWPDPAPVRGLVAGLEQEEGPHPTGTGSG